MTRFEWLKFAHVLLAVIWIGGSIVGNILASRAAKADQKHRLGFVEDVTALSDRVFAPAAIGTLVFGVLMVLDTDSLSFGDTWILIGLGGVLSVL